MSHAWQSFNYVIGKVFFILQLETLNENGFNIFFGASAGSVQYLLY